PVRPRRVGRDADRREDVRRGGHQRLDPHVAERDLVVGAVVLEADVAGRARLRRRVRERVHDPAVWRGRGRGVFVADLVVVPLTRGLGGTRRLALEVVDRAGLLVLAVAGDALADLDLVTLADRDVRVGARVREPDEDARVVGVLGRLPLRA